MRKRLIIAVTFLGGLYFIIEFLLPEHFPSGFGRDGAWRGILIGEYHEEILMGVQTVGMAAIGLGLINIFRVFGVNVLKQRKGWPFSLTLIAAMLAMMTLTFWLWFQDLDLQHEVGPLGVQREFQARILGAVGRAQPPDPQAAQRLQRTRDAALLRYLSDKRKAVSPPAVSTGEAAAQLSGLAGFLEGKGAAPPFFQVADGPENPPGFAAAQDLLALPKEAETGGTPPPGLNTPGADARLSQLARQRDELTGRLLKSSETLKAQGGIEVGPVVTEQAADCREVAPEFRKLAQEVRGLADAEYAVRAEPPDFALRYGQGPVAPPLPLYGRLYLAARALSHSATLLGKYANVLDQAAVEIPAAKDNEQVLSNWLEAKAQRTEALRQEWQQGAAGDLERAMPAVKAKLAGASTRPDSVRRRMSDDLQNAGTLGSAYSQVLVHLDKAGAVLASRAGTAMNPRAAAEAIARALAAIRNQEDALRLLAVRGLEQDLNYLDLAPEDAGKIVSAELSAQADAKEGAIGRPAEVLGNVAAAAKQVADELNARRQQMQAELDASVRGLRKTWREKTSAELRKLRDEEDARKREIGTLQTRAIVAAEAQKMAADAAARAAAVPEVDALAKLPAELAASKSEIAAVSAVAQARKTVAGGYLRLLQGAAKIAERFESKHDMKDLRPLTVARDGMRALSGAVQSDSLLHSAASDSRVAVQALGLQDLPAARKAMESSFQQIAQTQEGLKDALQERANRAAVKGLYKCLFDGLYVALGAAMFSLLAFYIASAAYRAFRVKSAEALLMMIAALLVMLGQIPFGAYLWSSFPQARLWVLQVFSTPAFRGIALGAAVAGLAMAMRMWLSLETSAFYREEEEGA